MDSNMCENFFTLSLLFLLLISSTSACDRCVHQSSAAYFSSASTVAAGACGYGSMAMGFNGGFVAAGSSVIHRGGIGCGACFQVRCKDTRVCTRGGVKVTLTDLNKNNDTGFILSSSAFRAMARNGMVQDLNKLGILDVEYKRIPCEYKNQNLSIRVEENSRRPNYLAIKFMYQGGQTDIVGVDVARVGSSNWQFMNRDYGPVWSTNQAPVGSLQFRLVVTSGYDGKWIWTRNAVLPMDWKTGSVYDLGVKVTEIAQEGCNPCHRQDWE
ncbi:expansin-like A1 [Zingiber officinale]|uniref:expansin-like A1 n=1 Tax=Zingiber officinale TaxID=94328 RepID=UPI001C4CF0E5|nr:expansin-like A1 [Zingiber officinale]